MESTSPHSAAGDSVSPYAETVPELPILDQTPLGEVDTNDFDPYNSGSFDWAKYRTGS